jgi:hypothetical protein
MKRYEAFDPVDITFLGFIRVVPDPKHLANLVKKLKSRCYGNVCTENSIVINSTCLHASSFMKLYGKFLDNYSQQG